VGNHSLLILVPYVSRPEFNKQPITQIDRENKQKVTVSATLYHAQKNYSFTFLKTTHPGFFFKGG